MRADVQNPMSQGGGRKGLPASFLNRFTKVYLSSLESEDLRYITQALYPAIAEPTLAKMIEFNQAVHTDTMVERRSALSVLVSCSVSGLGCCEDTLWSWSDLDDDQPNTIYESTEQPD